MISLVSGESIGTWKQGDCVDLIQTAVNASYVRISSITLPDSTQILTAEVTMEKLDNYYNYTFCNTNQFGIYQVSGYGDELGIEQGWAYTFYVTADGKPFQQFPQQFYIVSLGLILIFLSFFFERLRMFKHLGSIVLMVMGVLTLSPGYSFINWTTLFGKTIGFSFIGLGFYFLIEDSFSRGKQDNRYTQEVEDD